MVTELNKSLLKRARRDTFIFLALLSAGTLVLVAEFFLNIRGVVMFATFMLILGLMALARVLLSNRWPVRQTGEDERIRRIDAHSRARAWSITFLVVAVIGLGMTFDVFQISGLLVAWIVFMVMTYTWMIFRFYYSRKGDVE